MELLAPAGNYISFIGAVNAGADAIYLGGSKYGARAFADNFTDEEIIKAIRYAHLFNVKVYLTVNTLIKEKEWDDCVDFIRPFYEAGLDAVIVQDLGLISLFARLFPGMECHVSTQGFSTGLESVKYYKSLGASRVVLARELSLDEIKFIKQNEDIELETFIHGAMCYSYSGECLLSSCLGGRSGNRGRCAGPCRLPYSVIADNKETDANFYLSMKDQCTLLMIPKLVDAGIDSLKIEGRMKRAEYSAFVTAMYRKYIDLYKKDPDSYRVDPKDIENIKHIYLRSEIGEGYYHKYNGKEMISIDNPAYNSSDESLLEAISKEYLLSEKKIEADISFFAHSNEKIRLEMTAAGKKSITVYGDAPDKSINSPAKREDVISRLSKTGDTVFEVKNVHVSLEDGLFLPVKVLNSLRREACDRLEELLLSFVSERMTFVSNEIKRKKVPFERKPIISVLSQEQFDEVRKYSESAYICMPFEVASKNSEALSFAVLDLPAVIRKKDYSYLSRIIDFAMANNIKGLVVNCYEEILFVLKSGFEGFLIAGSGLYVFNNNSYDCLMNIFDEVMLPYELSRHEISDLDTADAYLLVYGKLPLMRSANCVLKTSFGCRCKEGDRFLHLKDRTNTLLPVYRDCNTCTNIVYNSVPTFIENDSSRPIVISFTDEGKACVNDVCRYYFEQCGEMPKAFTRAYWKRGVE